jgi:hypothetical protein
MLARIRKTVLVELLSTYIREIKEWIVFLVFMTSERRTETHGSGGLEAEANTEPMRTPNSLNSENQKPRGFREHLDERPRTENLTWGQVSYGGSGSVFRYCRSVSGCVSISNKC